jgi:hypothetical protein
MLFCSNGREGQFGQRFGDTDNGFQLPNGDWNGGTSVGFEFRGVDLLADGDEMGREFLSGFRGKAWCTSSVVC